MVWVVVHTNHAQEITARAEAALARLVDAGIPLLSQSVLLRGVNDSVAALEGLFRKLMGCRVKPYYLHHCDLAKGTSHFRTTIAEGQALMAGLRGRVSGTLLPTYVIDIPGGFGKVPLVRDHAEPLGDGAVAYHRLARWRASLPRSGAVIGPCNRRCRRAVQQSVCTQRAVLGERIKVNLGVGMG